MRLAILALAFLTGYASLAHADGMTAEDKALVAQHAKKHGKKSHKKAHAKKHHATHKSSVNYKKAVLPAGQSTPAAAAAPNNASPGIAQPPRYSYP